MTVLSHTSHLLLEMEEDLADQGVIYIVMEDEPDAQAAVVHDVAKENFKPTPNSNGKYAADKSYRIDPLAEQIKGDMFPKVLSYQGYQYGRHEVKFNKEGNVKAHYKCSHKFSRGCIAKMQIERRVAEDLTRIVSGEHTCNARIELTDSTMSIIGDVSVEKKLLTEAKCLADVSLTALQVADMVLQEMERKYHGNLNDAFCSL